MKRLKQSAKRHRRRKTDPFVNKDVWSRALPSAGLGVRARPRPDVLITEGRPAGWRPHSRGAEKNKQNSSPLPVQTAEIGATRNHDDWFVFSRVRLPSLLRVINISRKDFVTMGWWVSKGVTNRKWGGDYRRSAVGASISDSAGCDVNDCGFKIWEE